MTAVGVEAGGVSLDGRRLGAGAMTLVLCDGGTVGCTRDGSSERVDEERAVILSGPVALSAEERSYYPPTNQTPSSRFARLNPNSKAELTPD